MIWVHNLFLSGNCISDFFMKVSPQYFSSTATKVGFSYKYGKLRWKNPNLSV